MKTWKLIMLLVIVAGMSGCASGDAEDAGATAEPAVESAAPAASTTGSTAASTADAPKAAPAPAPAPKPIVVPAGTELSVVLADALHSGKNKAGDEFTANLAAPVVVNGRTILATGTRVQGKVVDAEGSGRVKGKATMTLALTSVTHNGRVVPLVTKNHFEEAKGTTGRDAGIIAGAAGVGAAIGAIAGGGKGAATGGAIGGAAGTGTVLATKGAEVEYPVETKLAFTLDKDLPVNP